MHITEVTQKMYSLHLSKEEAECLRAYLDTCLKYGNEFDPEYNGWKWKRQCVVLESISNLLPESL